MPCNLLPNTELNQLLSYAKVMENILFPWQFRSFDARPQEFFRMLEPFSLSIEKILQMPNVFRHTISHRTFETVPNKLVWIKLGSVSRKVIRKNAITGFKKSFNRARFVNSTRIPQENKTFLKMPKKIFKENQDFRITNVLRPVKTDIKSDPFSFSRNTDCGNSRYLSPSSRDFKNRRFTSGRPGFSDSRNKAKSAFIEENQGNSKRFRLFLYGATYDVSIVLFYSHPALWLWFRASDNSNPAVLKTTRDGWDDTIPQSVSGLPRRFFGLSRDQWSILGPKALPEESLSTNVSGASSFSPGAPAPVSTSVLRNLSSDDLSAIDEQSLLNNQFYRQQPANSILVSAVPQRAGAAAQAVFGFHMVSWNHDNTFKNNIPLLLRNSIYLMRFISILFLVEVVLLMMF